MNIDRIILKKKKILGKETLQHTKKKKIHMTTWDIPTKTQVDLKSKIN